MRHQNSSAYCHLSLKNKDKIRDTRLYSDPRRPILTFSSRLVNDARNIAVNLLGPSIDVNYSTISNGACRSREGHVRVFR